MIQYLFPVDLLEQLINVGINFLFGLLLTDIIIFQAAPEQYFHSI